MGLSRTKLSFLKAGFSKEHLWEIIGQWSKNFQKVTEDKRSFDRE